MRRASVAVNDFAGRHRESDPQIVGTKRQQVRSDVRPRQSDICLRKADIGQLHLQVPMDAEEISPTGSNGSDAVESGRQRTQCTGRGDLADSHHGAVALHRLGEGVVDLHQVGVVLVRVVELETERRDFVHDILRFVAELAIARAHPLIASFAGFWVAREVGAVREERGVRSHR